MPDSLPSCPTCNQTLTQVGKHWVCPEQGQVSLPKPAGPLRIFLSYGHDANEELVRRIKADLEKRGHDVWFDKSEIKFGDDWRRSITEGITGIRSPELGNGRFIASARSAIYTELVREFQMTSATYGLVADVQMPT